MTIFDVMLRAENTFPFKAVYPPAYVLLLQAISAAEEKGVEKAACIVAEGNVDWENVLALSAFHEVRPALYALLKGLPEGLAPAEVMTRLQAAQREIAVQQMAMAGEFLRVRKHLEKAGVLVVPFKGFWLAHIAYGHISLRECVDIDLYVHKNDYGMVAAVMRDLGYEPPQEQQGLPAEQVLQRGNYAFDKMEGDRRLFHFEFHWTLGNFKNIIDIGLPDLEGHMEKQPFQGQEIHVFSASANLLLATLHHGAKEYWKKLKQVQDMARFLSLWGEQLDWDWIMGQAKRLGGQRVILTGLGLAAALCGAKVPDSLATRVAAPGIQRLVADRIYYLEHPETHWQKGAYWRRLWYHVRTRERFQAKWRMVWLSFWGTLKKKLHGRTGDLP